MEINRISVQKDLKKIEIMGLVYKKKFSREKHNISPWSPEIQVHKNKIRDSMV